MKPLLSDTDCEKCTGILIDRQLYHNTITVPKSFSKLCSEESWVEEEDLGKSIRYKHMIKKTFRCIYCGRKETSEPIYHIVSEKSRTEWKDNECQQ